MTRADESIYRTRDSVANSLAHLEIAILGTLTSDKRNKLTEANIHLISAQQALEDASKL